METRNEQYLKEIEEKKATIAKLEKEISMLSSQINGLKYGEEVYIVSVRKISKIISVRKGIVTDCKNDSLEVTFEDASNIRFFGINEKKGLKENQLKTCYPCEDTYDYYWCNAFSCPDNVAELLKEHNNVNKKQLQSLKNQCAKLEGSFELVNTLLRQIKMANNHVYGIKYGDKLYIARKRDDCKYFATVTEVSVYGIRLKVFDYSNEPFEYVNFNFDDYYGIIKTTTWNDNTLSFVDDYFYFQHVKN